MRTFLQLFAVVKTRYERYRIDDVDADKRTQLSYSIFSNLLTWFLRLKVVKLFIAYY